MTNTNKAGTARSLNLAPRGKLGGEWDAKKIALTLMLKNANSAQRGKPCPVAARALARIEIALDIESSLNG